jgi:hypothetical protein
MRAQALQEDGSINYRLMADSEDYAEFRYFAQALFFCTSDDLGDRSDQIAFWINVYNALILDGIIQFRITRSMLQDPGFFRRAAYNIGGMRFSADDIEHGILRANRNAPTLPFPQFSSDDPRLVLSVRNPDPRIHFALVCGAYSCPPIAFYDGETLEMQLEAATRTFINQGGVQVDEINSKLTFSKIFKWYRSDFDDQGGVVEFVLNYLDGDLADVVRSQQPWKLSYAPYNWSLNGFMG